MRKNDAERGGTCLWVSPFCIWKGGMRGLNKIILAVLTAIVTICAEVINDKKED